MHQAPCLRGASLSAGRSLRPCHREGFVRQPVPAQAFRKQTGASSGNNGKARPGGKAQQPKQKAAPGKSSGGGGGGLMDMDVPVYAEAFDINKCVDLYLRFFKWVSSPVTGGSGKK